ncbi:MAG: hypothetical protein WC670_17605 [Pseudolabrys sp.]|jgi:hypothetical protein
MDHPPFSSNDNVIPLDGKLKAVGRDNTRPTFETAGQAGDKDDPRMKEAMALVEAFLAIEDQVARGALVTLAQQLVSYDWARRAQRR